MRFIASDGQPHIIIIAAVVVWTLPIQSSMFCLLFSLFSVTLFFFLLLLLFSSIPSTLVNLHSTVAELSCGRKEKRGRKKPLTCTHASWLPSFETCECVVCCTACSTFMREYFKSSSPVRQTASFFFFRVRVCFLF